MLSWPIRLWRRLEQRTKEGREKTYYVYVIKSLETGRLYTGQTVDLKRRLKEHKTEQTKSLKDRGPFKICYYEIAETRTDAIKREHFLKSGRGRIEKSQLIENFPAAKLVEFQKFL